MDTKWTWNDLIDT